MIVRKLILLNKVLGNANRYYLVCISQMMTLDTYNTLRTVKRSVRLTYTSKVMEEVLENILQDKAELNITAKSIIPIYKKYLDRYIDKNIVRDIEDADEEDDYRPYDAS